MPDKVRAHLYITGKVQGVFYRLNTQRAATPLNLAGWVRNLPDGAVEAVAEGQRADVEQLIAWCHKGSGNARVDEVRVDWGEYTGEFSGFEVTYI